MEDGLGFGFGLWGGRVGELGVVVGLVLGIGVETRYTVVDFTLLWTYLRFRFYLWLDLGIGLDCLLRLCIVMGLERGALHILITQYENNKNNLPPHTPHSPPPVTPAGVVNVNLPNPTPPLNISTTTATHPAPHLRLWFFLRLSHFSQFTSSSFVNQMQSI